MLRVLYQLFLTAVACIATAMLQQKILLVQCEQTGLITLTGKTHICSTKVVEYKETK